MTAAKTWYSWALLHLGLGTPKNWFTWDFFNLGLGAFSDDLLHDELLHVVSVKVIDDLAHFVGG